MRVLIHIIRKEFLQIFRNKAILPMMTILPIVQLIVLSNAANNEIKQVNLHITDQDKSQFSGRLIQKLEALDLFHIISTGLSTAEADEALISGKVDIALTIPPRAEQSFLKDKKTEVLLLANAINGQAATVGSGYLSQVINDYNKEVRSEAMQHMGNVPAMSTISIEYSNWYNPELDYKTFMVPGILGELVCIIIMVLTAMNIVREREVGTIEQINVSPIKKWQFIMGKMIPFLIVGMAIMTVGLTVGKLLFDIPIRGSLALIFVYVVLNLMAILGMGLLISNFAETQQQAIFFSFFFILIFILMSGLFTPIESMPYWAQKLTIPNPIAHFVAFMRQVLLKGSDFYDVQYRFVVTAILAIVFNSLAILSYRKTT